MPSKEVQQRVTLLERKYGSIIHVPEAELAELREIATHDRVVVIRVGKRILSRASTTLDFHFTVKAKEYYICDTPDEGRDLLKYVQRIYPQAYLDYV